MKWIRCSERLPENSGDIELICRARKFGKEENDFLYVVLFYDNNKWCTARNDNWENNQDSMFVTEWLDETDNTDEEKAFEAAREISDEILSNSYDSRKTYQKYETFQDYLKSKQK